MTGRVHTSFNQTVAATGRLSSSNPNLQNIPIRTDLGREIRRAFVAGPGKLLLSVDYSQIELRIMAHLSGDEALVTAFHDGKDVHRSTAALIFGLTENEVSSEQREWAKAVNFGIMYGMGRFGLARRLGTGIDEAAEFIDRYFETYPGVRDYTALAVEEAGSKGYAETMLGRRRAITGLDSENSRVRGMAERVAVNTPIVRTSLLGQSIRTICASCRARDTSESRRSSHAIKSRHDSFPSKGKIPNSVMLPKRGGPTRIATIDNAIAKPRFPVKSNIGTSRVTT